MKRLGIFGWWVPKLLHTALYYWFSLFLSFRSDLNVCLSVGSVLPVVLPSRCALRLHSKLQRLLHRTGWKQHGRGMSASPQRDHRRFRRGFSLPISRSESTRSCRWCGLNVSCLLFVFQLMDKECYKDIEKIKTIGSTYMAAVGLVPTTGSKVNLLLHPSTSNKAKNSI